MFLSKLFSQRLRISKKRASLAWTGVLITAVSLNSSAQNLCTKTLPYSEGFNNAVTPSCWSEVHVEGGLTTNQFSYVATATMPTVTPYEGSLMLKFNASGAQPNVRQRLTSPAISTIGNSNVHLEFMFYHSNLNPTVLDRLQVQYSLDSITWIDLGAEIIRANGGTDGWFKKSLILPSTADNQNKVYIGFLFKSSFGRNLFIDDVSIFSGNTSTTSVDSVKVNTLNNVAPIVTSGVLATQAASSLQLTSTVFPSAAPQTVNWTVPNGNSATATVNTSGLVSIPAQTQGLAWIKASSTANATKSDSLQLQVYCQPSHTNPINWFVIDTVQIVGTTLLNTVTALGNANAYQFFPELTNNTATLELGNTYNLKSHVTFSYGLANTQQMSYSLWIDYNKNGIFEASEWTEVTASTLDSVLSVNFTIPTTATPGKTMMRVRSRLAGSVNGPNDACSAFNGSGQTKDFIVTIAPNTNTACNNTMPGTTVGSTGCVTFTYQGQQTSYTTVRANDGNVWLQQNLGSTQVANAKTDTLAYGHMFQWGRWDDGHQIRTSTTGTIPSPNNPLGLGTGSPTFYTGSSSSAWWYGGLLSDTWSAVSNAQVSATDGCDPCKAIGNGWRMPTEADWQGIKTAEAMTNTNTAFNSNLKLTVAGSRSFTDGNYDFVGLRGYYWSSTPSSTGAKNLYYSDAIVNPSAGNNRGGGAAVRCIYSQTVGVTSIDVSTLNNVAATISTNGGTLQTVATILPSSANQNVTWSITPGTGTATISASGLVTALTNGTVYAKAISVADASKKDSLLINISNQITVATSINVSTQNNVAASITTNAGTLQTVATVLPVAANQNVTWSIVPVNGNASISNTGLVTALSNGTVYAKAVSVSNTNLKDSLLITISNQSILATSLQVKTVNNVAATITINAGELPLEAVFTPSNASNTLLTWSIVPVSGNANINSNGVVTAISNGTVFAKATSIQNGNIADSLLITISGQGVGLKEIAKGLNFEIHPNPAKTSFVVTLPNGNENALLTIISIDGRTMLNTSFEGKTASINIPNWSSGLNLVHIKTKDGYAIKKLVIE